MKPTAVLKEEHKDIKLMLQIVEKVCQKLEKKLAVPEKHLDHIVDFIRGFADKCHHAKEEDLLFPAMEACGVPRRGGPIGIMLQEHEEGRRYVRAMKDAAEKYKAGDKTAGALFVENARNYAALLDQHIDKENNILYEIADMHLSADQNKNLEKDFERVEHEVTGSGEHERFQGILHDLKKIYLGPSA